MATIQAASPDSNGQLESLVVDLSDLRTVAPAAREVSQKEDVLHGLVLNARIALPPHGSKGAQGHELQMTTNCLGGYLLLKCLEDLLVRSAKDAAVGEVRVVWLSSFVQVVAPRGGGIVWDTDKDAPKVLWLQAQNYMMTKVGNIFLAHDTAKRLADKGIFSVAVNPGLVNTGMAVSVVKSLSNIFRDPDFGACTELYGLLSPDITAANNGAFIIPLGRITETPGDVGEALKEEGDDAGGIVRRFIRWCERDTQQYR